MTLGKWAIIAQTGAIALLNILVILGALSLSRDQIAAVDASLVSFFGTIVTQTTVPKSQVPPPLGTMKGT